MADPTYTMTWAFQNVKPLIRIVGGSDDGLVTAVHWELLCSSSDGFSSRLFGKESFEKGDSVTPFADLTKTQVINWVKTQLGSEKCTVLESEAKKACIAKRTPESKSDAPTSWG